MLSVTTATVHRAMCPSTPPNSTPERKDRFWSCDTDNALSKRRCRSNPSRKNLSVRLMDPLELNVEVSTHPILDKTPETPSRSKTLTSKAHAEAICPDQSTEEAEESLKQQKNVRASNPRYKHASMEADSVQKADKAGGNYGLTSDEVEPAQPENREHPGELVSSSLDGEEYRVENDGQEKQSQYSPISEDTDGNKTDESVGSSSSFARTPGKRKRRMEDRLLAAVKKLKAVDDDVDSSMNEQTVDSTTDNLILNDDKLIDIPKNEILTGEQEIDKSKEQQSFMTEEDWNRHQESSQQQADNWVKPFTEGHEVWQNTGSSDWECWRDVNTVAAPPQDSLTDVTAEEPYYMTGFPNPPAENRCWLNATLQTLFTLPLVDQLGKLNLSQCSMITKTLVALQVFWKQGAPSKAKTYQTVARFKSQLDILDDSYPSTRQQDVSEFLMKLLNYVKLDVDKIYGEAPSADETENALDNSRAQKTTTRTPTKRTPLMQISPFKNVNGSRENEIRQSEACSPKSHDSGDESLESPNPIDEYFLLPMMEHYVCQSCSKHRSRKVDNMMLYVDLPDEETDSIELAPAIGKTLEPEDRTLTCGKCKCEEHKVFTSFRRSPNVLIVQLNRYGIRDGLVTKKNSIVHIPYELEIRNNESMGDVKCQKFFPVCIIAHVGTAMDCGHYTSYVKHGEQWFHYNDMIVTPMTVGEVLAAAETTAYLVFFVNAELLEKPRIIEDTCEELSR